MWVLCVLLSNNKSINFDILNYSPKKDTESFINYSAALGHWVHFQLAYTHGTARSDVSDHTHEPRTEHITESGLRSWSH